ncbi:MAG: AAA family ATPase, partial [Nanoarchaeota archaeon]
FVRLGVEAPKGVLLYGPPGTGKTLLAKAVANESGASFFTINGPEIMCVGEDVPIVVDNKINSAKELFESKSDKKIGHGNNHKSFSANGKLMGINNPSFSVTPTDLLEVTEVKVPYFYKINFDDLEYDVSSNHPLLTFSEKGISWKSAPMIAPGDHVVTSVIKNMSSPTINYETSSKIKVPKEFSNELAFLTGMIAGDGHVGKDNVTFCGQDRKLHEKFKKITKNIFEINKFKEHEDKEGNIRTVVYSTDFVRFFNYIGFNSGKKEYSKFLDNWLIKFDQKIFTSFLLGMLVTDGTIAKHSIILYSNDKGALEKMHKIGTCRGLCFNKPVEHTNKWSSVKKLILKGRYNLELFQNIINELGIIDCKVPTSERSYEYVPKFIMKLIKPMMKRANVSYGNDYKLEPYINLRKKPTMKTVESCIKILNKRSILLIENDKAIINLLERFVNKEIVFDEVSNVSKVNKEKTLYDFGTAASSFITAYGHVMHNSKWYGQSEENLRKIFEEAEKEAPSIIFIDEIDAIAPKRGEVSGEVERRVVSQILTLMDGLKSRGKVIVIAATNRENSIDPALRRPGRFDREIEMGVPDKRGRKEILQIHTRNMPLTEDVDLNKLASITYGFVGADLEALAKEAAMSALRRNLPEISWRNDELPTGVVEKLIVTKEDFQNALKMVEPSAMREVLVEIPNIKWSDIGGLEEIKKTLKEVIEWPLKHASAFERIGIKPPTGVLLYGPPGTGKTLLAKAVANESGSNFISIKGPEVFNKWVGESEKKIREIFKRAKQVAPSIVFFDEIDAIAPHRGMNTGNRVSENIVSQILTEMSGLEDLHNVVVIAATNRPDMIDSALLRPGRFDRQIVVPAPDEKARYEIFKVHTKKMPLEKSINLKSMAKEAEGYTGADIEAICREAGMNALRENIKSEIVTKKHFDEAMKNIKPSLTDSLKNFYDNMEKQIKAVRVKKSEDDDQMRYVG